MSPVTRPILWRRRAALAPLLLGGAALLAPGAAPRAAPVALSGDRRPLPELRFEDLAGNAGSLADFSGRVVVLNLWATWCAPCREEMPALDRLQGQLDPAEAVVLALSVDRAGSDKVKAFIDEIGAARLVVRRDPTAATARTLKAPGLPVTLMVDRAGREAGRVLGAAVWDGPDAVAAVRSLLAEPSG